MSTKISLDYLLSKGSPYTYLMLQLDSFNQQRSNMFLLSSELKEKKLQHWLRKPSKTHSYLTSKFGKLWGNTTWRTQQMSLTLSSIARFTEVALRHLTETITVFILTPFSTISFTFKRKYIRGEEMNMTEWFCHISISIPVKYRYQLRKLFRSLLWIK